MKDALNNRHLNGEKSGKIIVIVNDVEDEIISEVSRVNKISENLEKEEEKKAMGADERLLLKVDEALKLFSDENDRCYFGMEPGGDYYTG